MVGVTLQVLGWLCSAVLGAALLAWADELSIRYNKWSTGPAYALPAY